VSLWKRGGIWWTYVWVDGIRHAKSTGTGSKRIAEKVDEQFKDELTLARLGMSVPHPEMAFGELAARFLAEGTPKPYHVDRLKLLLPYFGETPIGRIHKGLVREYRAHRHAQKTVSDTTINRDLECLRHLLYWAVDEGLLAANPLSRMSLIRERRKPRMVMNVAEEERLLNTAAPHFRPIVTAALDTGMRRGAPGPGPRTSLRHAFENGGGRRARDSAHPAASRPPLRLSTTTGVALHLQRAPHPHRENRLEGHHPPRWYPLLPVP